MGSILIGGVLGTVAVLLARESKGLLIGERARPELTAGIRAIACAEPGVCAVNEAITIHLAPEQVVAIVSLDFEDELTTRRIEAAVRNIEARVRTASPEVVSIYIRPEARGG